MSSVASHLRLLGEVYKRALKDLLRKPSTPEERIALTMLTLSILKKSAAQPVTQAIGWPRRGHFDPHVRVGVMSALGQNRTLGSALGMSALPPIADIEPSAQNVR